MELIHRPFFIINMGISYPYGGCAVADNFFGSGEWADRPPGVLQGDTGTVRGTGHRKSRVFIDGHHGASYRVVDPLTTALDRVGGAVTKFSGVA